MPTQPHMTPDVTTALFALLALGIQLGVLVWVIVLVVFDYRAFAKYWRRALLLAVALFVLQVPVMAFDLAYFDPPPQPNVNVSSEALLAIHSVVLVFQMVFMAGLVFVVFCVAGSEWGRARPPAMPLLTGSGRAPWPAIGVGAAIGVAFGAVTSAVFILLDVGESQLIQMMAQNYPGVADAPPMLLLMVSLLFVIGPAVGEEVVFRGALLGFLARVTRNRGVAIYASIVLISLMFASLHLLNTDAPAIKFAQIFVFGLILGEIVRRSSLEAAIACHLGLNITATLFELMHRFSQ